MDLPRAIRESPLPAVGICGREERKRNLGTGEPCPYETSESRDPTSGIGCIIFLPICFVQES